MTLLFCQFVVRWPRNIRSRTCFNVNHKCNSHSSTQTKDDVIDEIFPDTKGTPREVPKNYLKIDKRRGNKLNKDFSSPPSNAERTGHVVIQCKNKEFNHYKNQTYDKFTPIPLASKGWNHRLSRGDYFKINIFPDKEQRENVFFTEGVETFSGLGLEDEVVEAICKAGFTRPTHIQGYGIPQILRNQNTLLAGETGCGKTLAYLAPLVQQVMWWRRLTPERKLNSPLALVLSPGRELTYQIADMADKLAKELQFDLDVTVGGHTRRMINYADFKPVDLLISSTGAAAKLTAAGVYNMQYVRHVVLDEADTILDDSFSQSVVRYLKKFPLSYGQDKLNPGEFPRFCRFTMASATMPTSIPDILGSIIMPDSLVRVETPRLHKVLVHVPQKFCRLGQSQKPQKLLEILKKNVAQDIPTIIFSNRAKACDWVSLFLNENGVSCVNLTGDMPVDVRAGRFDQFQRGFIDVLSCTDMASRGLDTIRAKHVVNYDFPVYMSDYIHRCGRVGRVGHTDDRLITNFVCSPLEVELTQKIETAVRTMSALPNVNANITRAIHYKIMKSGSMT